MDTKFPSPEEPENWQAAYTADNAYYDTSAVSSNASFIETVSLLTALIFSIALLFSRLPPRQYLFSLDLGLVNQLDMGQLTPQIREAFQSHSITLTDCAKLTAQKAGSEWVIKDTDGRYLILNEKQTLNAYAKENGLVAYLYSKFPPTHYLFGLDPGLTSSLDTGQLTPQIFADFQSRGVTLTACAKLIVQKAGSEWVIIDTGRQYLIRHEQQTLNVYAQQDEIIALAILGIMLIIYVLVRGVFQWVGSLAFYRAEKFFEEFYLPPGSINTSEVIIYRLGGRIKLPMPFREWFTSISQFKYILVKDGDFLKKDQWPVWLARNVGGPILLIVYDGSALYIERGNRFSRVVGPGASFLERYETIKYAVDLRTKSKTDKIEVWTKDGITVKLRISIEYRIGDPQKMKPDDQLIYPYDREAVKKAVERYSLRWPEPTQEPSEFTWEDAAWGQVTGIVPDYIGSRYLDDLLVADRKGGQILSPDASDKILEALNKATKAFGVYVTDFQILSIEVPEKAEQYYVKYWEAEKESFAKIMDGKAKAFDIRAREKVRARAQHDLILAIADGLKKADDLTKADGSKQNENERFKESLLLSLSEILDRGLSDPYMRNFTAKETLETLEKVRNILDDKENL